MNSFILSDRNTAYNLAKHFRRKELRNGNTRINTEKYLSFLQEQGYSPSVIALTGLWLKYSRLGWKHPPLVEIQQMHEKYYE